MRSPHGKPLRNMDTAITLQQHLSALAGTKVVAHRRGGVASLHGRLSGFAQDGEPALRLHTEQGEQRIPFSELRYAFFSSPQTSNAAQQQQPIDYPLPEGGRLQGAATHVIEWPEAHLISGFGPATATLDVLIPTPKTEATSDPASCNDSQLHPRSPAELAEQLQHLQQQPPLQLGDSLLQRGLLTATQLQEALQLQQKQGGRLGEIVVAKGWVAQTAIAPLLQQQQGIIRICLDQFQPAQDALQALPQNAALAAQALPLLIHQGRLVVAMQDPMNESQLQRIRMASRMDPRPLQTIETRLAALIRRHYEPIESPSDVEEITPDTEQTSITLVESILNQAVQLHASDIHLQPTRRDIQVRYRIDGVLEEVASHPRNLLPGLVGRIKVLGHLDIAEHRVPQDGSYRWSHHGHNADLRISIMPTVNGESVVIRVLDPKIGMRRLDSIGFRPDDEAHLRRLLQTRDGMILVTGPTGSGKSTTLYAALATLNQEALNIITVENPVEYHLSGIKQIEVNPATGYDFARALRSILRHDPDVILVGEIRDHETLTIAMEAALTGHLVLSTLHTNNAASTLARLLEMGAADYLIRDTLRGVLAQRLVRLNCPHCLAEEEVSADLRQRLGLDASTVFQKGQGCDRCRNTGYLGRTAIYELLEVTPALREQLGRGITSTQIEQQAILDGMATLRENAIYLAKSGKTSIAELQRTGLL